MRPLDVALAVLVAGIWGFNFVAAKAGVTQLPPLFLLAIRFALAALILVPLVRFPRQHLWPIYGVSVTMAMLHFGLLFFALKELDAGAAAITVQLTVPFSAILAWIFFEDRLGWRGLFGMLMAFTGVVLIAGEARGGDAWISLFVVIGSALAFAVASIQIKRMAGVDPMSLNAWLTLFAAPQMLLASFLLEDGQLAALAAADWQAYGSILYVAIIASIVGHGLWYHLLGRYQVNQITPFTFLVPAIGVLSGAAVFGEPLTWRIIAGCLVTTVGVAIIVMRRARKPKPQSETAS